MENKIEIFKNEELGELRTVLNSDGSISVSAEDTARGFGWSRTQNVNGKDYVSIRWERINGFIEEFGFHPQVGEGDFIPESLFYLLGMKANNESARKFQMWLAKDVIPSIRKHGMYITEELLKDKEKLQFELDKIYNNYYELEHKNTDLEFDVKHLQVEKEELEEQRSKMIQERESAFKLSIKTHEKETYLPNLTIQAIRYYINNNKDVILDEDEEGFYIKLSSLVRELKKLILNKNDRLYVLCSLGINISDRVTFIPKKFMNEDYEVTGISYL